MEQSDFTHHILTRFNEDLKEIRTRVMQMGDLVEAQLKRAVDALIHADSEAGEEVARNDHKINAMEVEIDDECNRVLAMLNPTASDLRFIIAVIKIIADLERIGDETEKIGYIGARLASVENPVDRYREIKHIGRLVAGMVREAMDSFARLDPDAAIAAAKKDRQADEEYEAVQRQCITFMLEDPREIRRALDVLWVARAIERIGDHAKNICEHVIYLVCAKDVRHVRLSEVEQQLQSKPEDAE